MLKSTSDTWTNWGAEKGSSIPNIKLVGWSWESTSSRIPARPHPSIITPVVLPAEAAKRWREGREGAPQASGGWPLRHGEDQRHKQAEKKCAWGQNTRQTGLSLPDTAPHSGPWCQQSCPEHTQTRCWACSWYLRDASKPPADTHPS